MLLLLLLSHFSCVLLWVTLWTAAHQALPSTGFSRQEYWSGLPFPSPAWYIVSAIYASSSLVPGVFWRCHTCHTASFGGSDSWSLTRWVIEDFILALESKGRRAGKYSKLQQHSNRVWVAEAAWESPWSPTPVPKVFLPQPTGPSNPLLTSEGLRAFLRRESGCPTYHTGKSEQTSPRFRRGPVPLGFLLNFKFLIYSEFIISKLFRFLK